MPAIGLSSGHAQTLFGAFARRPKAVPQLRRERRETADGDFIDVDVLEPNDATNATVVLLHGFEGSTSSGYMRLMIGHCAERGFGVQAINFRGCSGEPNRFFRSYSSGDTTDLKATVARLQPRRSTAPLYAVGFSLGANVLLKYLAEEAEAGLDKAVGVSPPFDLAACARALDGGGLAERLYVHNFLHTLMPKARAKARQFPGVIDEQALERVDGLWSFDEAVTSKLYGLPSAAAYYEWAACGPKLQAIRTPTLLITADDDPIAPAGLLPASALKNPALTLARTARGGHVGFIEGAPWRPRFWAETTTMEWLTV